MDTVRASDTGRILETKCLPAQHLDEILDIFQQYLVGLLDEIPVGRIHHIGTRQTIMHPLALLAKRLADGTRESHDIVMRLLLYFLYTVYAERRLLPQLGDILLRNDAELAPRLRSKYLHPQVCLEFPLFRPNGPHGRPAVSLYHICIGFAKEQRYKITGITVSCPTIISSFFRPIRHAPCEILLRTIRTIKPISPVVKSSARRLSPPKPLFAVPHGSPIPPADPT